MDNFKEELEQMEQQAESFHIDWEGLARQLQEALAKEIKEGDEWKLKVQGLEATITNLQHSARYMEVRYAKLQGVVEYLEAKLEDSKF